MNRSMVFKILVFLLFSVTPSGAALGEIHSEHDRIVREHAVRAEEPALKTVVDLKKEIRALRQRVAALEALKPMFTNFMPNFSERFHVMHHSGEAGDWAVAAHEIVEMQRLTRVSKYIDPKLGALMQGFMEGNLRKLKEAIEHGSAKAFQAALKDTVASCNGCHSASGNSIFVSLDVDDSLSMRHAHALRKSTVPQDHAH